MLRPDQFIFAKGVVAYIGSDIQKGQCGRSKNTRTVEKEGPYIRAVFFQRPPLVIGKAVTERVDERRFPETPCIEPGTAVLFETAVDLFERKVLYKAKRNEPVAERNCRDEPVAVRNCCDILPVGQAQVER
jgi:hypothetical protein